MHWFMNAVPNRAAVVRLLCLPYAGASAAVYRDWGRLLRNVDVQAAQLPGRAWRLREPVVTDLRTLADQIVHAFLPLTDIPFGIFGHSMGAWLGMLVARRLEARGLAPLFLMASGRQAPSLGCTQPPLRHLDDGAFVDQLSASYGGIPEEVFQDPELLALLLPGVRADVTALETYVHTPGPTLACPLVALGGESDPMVPVRYLAPWATETTGPFEVQTFPGGHFYFQEDVSAVVGHLERWLVVAPGAHGVARP
jgi:surfactin synthase thioesterase subunit